MKSIFITLFSFLIISVMVMSGCQSKDPVSMQGTGESNALVRPDDFGSILETGDDVLFKLPPAKSGDKGNASVTKLVSPGSATIFKAELTYTSVEDKIVDVVVNFTIPRGAVTDTVTVTMALDTVVTAINFYPEGLQFVVPASLDVSIKNIDPFWRNIVGFLYVNPNGTYSPQEFASLTVTGNEGKIMMNGGIIRHFSQYGFGRRSAVAAPRLTN